MISRDKYVRAGSRIFFEVSGEGVVVGVEAVVGDVVVEVVVVVVEVVVDVVVVDVAVAEAEVYVLSVLWKPDH